MPTLLERYQSGDRRSVWTDMMALGESVRRKEHLEDAKAVARETMLRARDNVETLITRLGKLGYRFFTGQDGLGEVASTMEQAMRLSRELSSLVPPGGSLFPGMGALKANQPNLMGMLEQLQQRLKPPAAAAAAKAKDPLQDPEVWSRPEKKTVRELDRFEKTIGGPLPLSLRAWCEQVGSVSLMGTHETLCFREGGGPMKIGLGFGLSPDEPGMQPFAAAAARAGVEVVGAGNVEESGAPLPDPLVIQPYFDEWEEAAEYAEEEEPGLTELSLAPDDLHKANISGGDPYGMKVPDPAADGIFTDANRLLFVDYLRLAFQWGGFPGWARYPQRRPDRELQHLAEGLLEI